MMGREGQMMVRWSGECQVHIRQVHVHQVCVSCASGARQVQVRCASGARQMHVRCTSGARQVHVRCTSGARQVHVRCTSVVHQVIRWMSNLNLSLTLVDVKLVLLLHFIASFDQFDLGFDPTRLASIIYSIRTTFTKNFTILESADWKLWYFVIIIVQHYHSFNVSDLMYSF